MTEKKRVVITGLGAVSTYGFGEDVLWEGLLGGRTGIGLVKHIDTEGLKTRVGATVDREGLRDELRLIRLRYNDFSVDSAILAADMALKQSGLIEGERPYEPQEVATLIGTGIGCPESYYGAVQSFLGKGVKGVRPTTVPRCMSNAACSQIAIRYGLTGPNYSLSSACASSSNAIGVGYRMIKDGYIGKVLCGGTDTIFDPFTMIAWDRLGVMSRNPDPETACRPFDLRRDGCVIGEGAACLVLESLESALGRGARIRAEVIGYGEASDAKHITTPDPEGQGRCIRAALESSGVVPEEVGYINAHGTATRANDSSESSAIRSVLGVESDRIPVSSMKSFFGHLLGGSGALETLASVKVLEEGLIPANLNLDDPDPECAVNLMGSEPCRLDRPVVLKNSFGFGGNNAVLVLRRWED